MNLYGLLLTKGDPHLVAEWCEDQPGFYDAVVCLDGTTDDSVADVLHRHPEIIVLREADLEIPKKVDHGLRRIADLEIRRRFGTGHWVMCCHPDEFCYHDPRKIAAKAEGEGYDLVSWYSPHFYPHPSERENARERMEWPLEKRFQHYHWSHFGNGLPWIEDRLYRLTDAVHWDAVTHGSVRPHGIERPAPFRPIFRHYKIFDLDPSRFEITGHASHYKDHWMDGSRTGVAFHVHGLEDLFVEAIPKYHRCSRYERWFSQTWNMGDEYCPDAEWTTGKPGTDPFVIRDRSDQARVEQIWHHDVYGLRTARITPQVVLDVSAHVGEFARLALHAWPEVRLIACAGHPERLPILTENLSTYAQAEIVCATVVSENTDRVPLSNSPQVLVPAIPILRLIEERGLDRIDWLMIDADGEERSLLTAMAAAGILSRVGWISGTCHSASDSEAGREFALQELMNLLGPTHSVRCRPATTQTLSPSFIAMPRNWPPHDHQAT